MNYYFLIGFVTGCLLTAFVAYYLQKFTGTSTPIDKSKSKKFNLEKLFLDYPHFMNAIKKEMKDPNNKNIREFFVVEKTALLNMSVPRLRYELSDEIVHVLNQLEEWRYIEKLKSNCLLYKMHEDFIFQLKSDSTPKMSLTF